MCIYIRYFIVILCLTVCCSTNALGQIPTDTSNPEDCHNPLSKVNAANQVWSCHLKSKNITALRNSYTDTAIKIQNSGVVIQGSENIGNHYIKNGFNIDSMYIIKRITANNQKTYDYEIGAFRTKDNTIFKHLIIWSNQHPEKRTFEFISKSENTIPIAPEINKRREEWITLCNLHNIRGLVEELYTTNAIYFNHKPAIIGTDAIVKEYQYMNNVNYKLSLEPITVEMITENLALEIGQCQGSYNGKYILIWQKDHSNQWKILVDSNI